MSRKIILHSISKLKDSTLWCGMGSSEFVDYIWIKNGYVTDGTSNIVIGLSIKKLFESLKNDNIFR